MPLNIHWLKDTQPRGRILIGEIVLNDYVERFEASSSFWKARDYEQQWSGGLARLRQGELKSCLITDMYDPSNASFIRWWPIFRSGEQIVIQEQILFLDRLDSPFNPSDPYRFIGDRKSISDDGERVSEWVVNLDSL